MKSNLPLIIFGLFFILTLVGFIIFRKKEEEEEEAQAEANTDTSEPETVDE